MSEGKKYKRIAIISAIPVELLYVAEFLRDRKGWQKKGKDEYEYPEKEIRVFTRVVGAGKVNAAFGTADLLHDVSPDLIVNVGYAGGLAKGAKKGDVAIGTDYVQVDFEPLIGVRPPEAESPARLVNLLKEQAKELHIPVFSGRIATGDFFLHDSEQKKQIINDFAPIAFDMESAAIAQVVANKENVDFVVLRTFSDLADDDAVESIKDSGIDVEDARIPIEQRPVTLILTALERVSF